MFANDSTSTKVIIVGQQIQGKIYSNPEKENDFLLPLEETSKLLGAKVYTESNGEKISIILLNFPTSDRGYSVDYPLLSTQYIFDGVSGKVTTLGEELNGALRYPPQTMPIMIDGVMYLSSEDIVRMFNQDAYYNTSKNIYNIGYYSVPASGEHEGWQLLKGYPLEDKYNFYFRINTDGKFGSTSFDSEVLNPPDMNETVTFTFQGKTYTTTRKEAYNFLSNIDNIAGDLQAVGADNTAMDLYRSTSGQIDDEYSQYMSESLELNRYYDRYNIWVMRLNRNEKLSNFVTEEEFKKQVQKKENEKALKLAAEDINNYFGKMEYQWEMLNKPEFSEWDTMGGLAHKYNLSIYPSFYREAEWELFRKNEKLADLPFPIEGFNTLEPDTICNSNGIRMKILPVLNDLAFNVYDLQEKGYITINEDDFKPSKGKYVNDKVEEYIKNKYPEIDPIAFYKAY